MKNVRAKKAVIAATAIVGAASLSIAGWEVSSSRSHGATAQALSARSVTLTAASSGANALNQAAAPAARVSAPTAARVSAPAAAQATARVSNVLRAGQVLWAGHYLRSANKQYTLLQQQDGNLVLYRGKKALWGAGTERHPGAATLMQPQGNLVIYSKTKHPLWSTNSQGNRGAYLAVQNDGNLVVYSRTGKALWWRSMYNAILPSGYVLSKAQPVVLSLNRSYALLMQADGNLVLYRGKTALWGAGTEHHPGAYAVMQTDGNLVVYSSARRSLWSTGTEGNPGAYLVVQNDGNLVLYSRTGKALWWRNIYISVLPDGYKLSTGQAVLSQNRQYFLAEQTDGNLVLYKGSISGGTHRVLWGMPAKAPGNGAYAMMQTDGNFVVYSRSQHSVWATNTYSPGAFLAVQNDGNLVLYSAAGKAIWSTGT
jgi:hypothetical protein